MNASSGLALAASALACWSIAPFFFTAAGRRIGPLGTNMLRLAFAAAALCAIALIRSPFGPVAPWPHAGPALWLIASGAIGLAVGDAFLYRAFVGLGPERTSQIQTLAPASTAALAWLGLGEVLSWRQLSGMALILGGVLAATTSAARASRRARAADLSDGPRPAGRMGQGAWAALWSALFQGVGTVLARKAFLSQSDLDPVLATAIRVGSGTAALWAYARLRGPLGPVLGAWRAPATLRPLLAGVLFGPVAGMLCYIAALKWAPAGIVTTVTFMAPLLIIPIGARLYGTRVGWAALAGTALSLAGVLMLGIG